MLGEVMVALILIDIMKGMAGSEYERSPILGGL